MKNIAIICLLLLSSNLFSIMPIDNSEKDGITMISESVKLSKDIYHELHRIWGVGLFESIEKLEEENLKAINNLLDKYSIKDPNTGKSLGAYNSPYMEKLFNDFSNKYTDSEYEALRIAATIEDLMISDLNELLEFSTNSDITGIYTNLRLSAISQIRAVNNLMKKKYKVEYQAQFLSRVELKAILLN